ncbi:MAG: type 1 glutamine amidotransferase [Candidatus Omnitrophota bacterium]
MTAKVWFIKNMTHEAAGLLSSFASKEKIPYEIMDLHKGDLFPEVHAGQAVVILGGPDSANDTTPKILSELEALQKCLREGIPCLGVCLGLQLLVKAAGGTVFKNPVKEIGFRDPSGGWFEMAKTAEGQNDPLLEGIPDVCKVFQLHGETVGLTLSMTCLAQGKFCNNQIVKIQERVYGIQGHVELSEQMFEDWLAADGDLHKMNIGELHRDFLEVRGELEQSSEDLFKNFLRISSLVR